MLLQTAFMFGALFFYQLPLPLSSTKTNQLLMKKLLALLSIIFSITAFGQDTVTVSHGAYTTVFVKSAHIPVLVTYTLHKSDLDCTQRIPRTNNFKADPDISGTSLGKDYAGSGYDQGHCMSAQDNGCNPIYMAECFYYSNMIPQTPNLNRGVWKQLEVQERLTATMEDSIWVAIGASGKLKTIGPDGVIVPKYCWKVIYHFKTKESECWQFPNTDNCPGKPADYLVKDPKLAKAIGYSIGLHLPANNTIRQ